MFCSSKYEEIKMQSHIKICQEMFPLTEKLLTGTLNLKTKKQNIGIFAKFNNNHLSQVFIHLPLTSPVYFEPFQNQPTCLIYEGKLTCWVYFRHCRVVCLLLCGARVQKPLVRSPYNQQRNTTRPTPQLHTASSTWRRTKQS